MSPRTFTDSPATGVGAVATLPSLNANQLRYLGEKADGLRGDLVLVMDEEGKIDVVLANQVNGRKVLFQVKTESEGLGVSADAQVQLRCDGEVYDGHDSDLERADAVFVTQSAVEKFLLPYYMRFRTPDDVNNLKKKAFGDENCIAIIHTPDSVFHAFDFPTVAVVSRVKGVKGGLKIDRL